MSHINIYIGLLLLPVVSAGTCPWYLVSCVLDYLCSLVSQMVKNPPAMQETWVQSLGWEDPLEKGMATHSSILVWNLPMDREAWLQSMGSQRVRHVWVTTHTHTHTHFPLNNSLWKIFEAYYVGGFLYRGLISTSLKYTRVLPILEHFRLKA